MISTLKNLLQLKTAINYFTKNICYGVSLMYEIQLTKIHKLCSLISNYKVNI